MEQNLLVTVWRSDILPQDNLNRVKWIENHGKLEAKSIEIEARAELGLWAKAGATITETAEIDATALIIKSLQRAIAARLYNDPTGRSIYDATPVLQAILEQRAADFEQRCKIAEELTNAPINSLVEEAGGLNRSNALSPEAFDVLSSQYYNTYLSVSDDDPCRDVLASIRAVRDLRVEQAKQLATREREQRQRMKEDARAARKAAIRQWVKENGEEAGLSPHIIRAAEEDRSVSAEVKAVVDLNVLATIEDCIPDGEITEYSATDFEIMDRVPTPEAYEIRDALIKSMGAIAASALLPDVKVTVSDFGRCTVNKKYCSAIDVKVEHPWYPEYDFGQMVLTESCPEPEDKNED